MKLATLLLVCALAGTTALPTEAQAAELRAQTENMIYRYFSNHDCESAVKLLNKSLAEKAPETYLLAGTMYEDGICLKKSWEKAIYYYLLAEQAPLNPKRPQTKRRALSRIIGTLAIDQRDPGTALWWASRASNIGPAACHGADHLRDDPDAFTAALNNWGAAKLSACVYTIGLLHRISGDVAYPRDAVQQGISGTFEMTFTPSLGSINWRTLDSSRLTVSHLAQPGNTEARLVKKQFVDYFEAISKRASADFPKPDNIDPAWEIKEQFSFEVGFE